MPTALPTPEPSVSPLPTPLPTPAPTGYPDYLTCAFENLVGADAIDDGAWGVGDGGWAPPVTCASALELCFKARLRFFIFLRRLWR